MIEASAETDEVVRLNLPRVLPKAELEKVCCIEVCVADTEFKYAIITSDAFYLLAREELTGKTKRLATPMLFQDVIDVDPSEDMSTLFEEDALNERSKLFYVAYTAPNTAPKPPAEPGKAGRVQKAQKTQEVEDEPTTIEIYSYAKNSMLLFYFRRHWLNAMKVCPPPLLRCCCGTCTAGELLLAAELDGLRSAVQRKYDFTVSYRSSIGLDTHRQGKTLKERVAKQMRKAALLQMITSGMAPDAKPQTLVVAEGGALSVLGGHLKNYRARAGPRPARTTALSRSYSVAMRRSTSTVLPSATQETKELFKQLEDDFWHLLHVEGEQDLLQQKFDLMEELAVALHSYRLVQRSFWSSELMFKMIVQELRQYAWLSDGWRRTATAAQRSTEILPDRIEYCVMLMEVLRNALSCEFAERIKFARVNANLTCVAELIWLLPQCGEFITKADLAEMDVSEETGGEDGGSDRATSGVDAEQSKSSFGGSTMVAVDEISEVELEKLAAEIAAEKSAVMGKLNDRARANLSYMTDLCSSVLYNLLYLVEQSEAGGTRLTDRLLTRMFENAQEEWVRCYSSCMWNHLCVCGGVGGTPVNIFML